MNDAFQTTEIEKTNLEAHVGMCSLRFQQLNERLKKVEEKVDAIHSMVKNSNAGLVKVIIGAVATFITGVASIIVTILMKF